MIELSQQKPDPRNFPGYRPLVPQVLSKRLGNSSAALVAAAVGLGLVIGVSMGLAGRHSNAAGPRVSGALGTHASRLIPVPAVYAATTPSLLSQVDKSKKTGAVTSSLLKAIDNSTRKSTGAHKKHRLHRIWNWRRGFGRNVAHRRPYVSPMPVAETDPPTGLQLATAAAAAGPFFMGIEGDATVANYDAGSGAIQTYEGSNFLLAKATEPSAIPWQDCPFNVHFRCDETGNCTLIHHGAIASARLAQ